MGLRDYQWGNIRRAWRDTRGAVYPVGAGVVIRSSTILILTAAVLFLAGRESTAIDEINVGTATGFAVLIVFAATYGFHLFMAPYRRHREIEEDLQRLTPKDPVLAVDEGGVSIVPRPTGKVLRMGGYSQLTLAGDYQVLRVMCVNRHPVDAVYAYAVLEEIAGWDESTSEFISLVDDPVPLSWSYDNPDKNELKIAASERAAFYVFHYWGKSIPELAVSPDSMNFNYAFTRGWRHRLKIRIHADGYEPLRLALTMERDKETGRITVCRA